VDGGNIRTAGLISATGNITAPTFFGNLVGNITGNIDAGGANTQVQYNNNDIIAGSAGFTFDQTANLVTVAGNIQGGNIRTAGLISAAGNVQGGNVIASGNILTVGQVSATGNVTGNFFIGNGALLTGLNVGAANSIANGATNISIPVASGNISMSVQGQSNTVVISTGTFSMYGTFAGPKTLEANVLVAPDTNAVLFGPVAVDPDNNISVPDSSTLYIIGSF
jgi:hypothetical protein